MTTKESLEILKRISKETNLKKNRKQKIRSIVAVEVDSNNIPHRATDLLNLQPINQRSVNDVK